MDAIIKFKEAAKALQEDERYLALQAARKANDENKELQDKIGQFNLLRLDLNNEMSKEDKDGTRVMNLNNEVSALYNEIMSDATMVAYEEAKQNIEQFMEHVNAVLNAAIDGKDPMQVEAPEQHDCSGGCGSCAGCH